MNARLEAAWRWICGLDARISELLAGKREAIAATALGALVIAVVSRPPFDLTPRPGLEYSYQSALHMAADQGLNFGREVVFTYGPLGYLEQPGFWFQSTGGLQVLAGLLLSSLLAAALILVCRRYFGWPVSLLLAFLGLSAIVSSIYQPAGPVIVMIAALATLRRGDQDSARKLAVAAGAFAGILLLSRISAGIGSAAVITCALLFLPDRRHTLPLGAAAMFTAFVVGWMLTGQSLFDLPRYALGSISIVSGYSQAMGVDIQSHTWSYTGARVLAVGALAAAWMTGRNGDRDLRWPLVTIMALFMFLLYKQGYVRNDGHDTYYFSGVTVAIAALPWSREQRQAIPWALAAGLVLVAAANNAPLRGLIDPSVRAKATVEALRTAVDSQRADALAATGAKGIIAVDKLPPDFARRLRQVPSAAWPSEQQLVWVSRGPFRPLPTIEGYTAYAPRLDSIGATMLRDGARAPVRIIYTRDAELDARPLVFDAPETTRELLCNYRAEGRPSGRLLMLRRVADRCVAPARQLSSVKTKWGQTAAVPQPTGPDSFVFARIRGAGLGPIESLRSTAFRAYERRVRFSDGSVGKVIPGNLEGGAIVRAGANADLPGAFRISPETSTLTFTREDNPSGDLTIDFYEQPLRR